MAVTVKINGLTLVHKDSGGIATATLPDVCKTQVGSAIVAIPYANVAKSSDLKKGTISVFVDGGNSAAISGSELSISTGDEAGTLGGIKSSVNKSRATWLSCSFDVKMEGNGACRNTDKMLMNAGNTACLAGILNGEFAAKNADVVKELQQLCEMMCKEKDIPGRKQDRIAKKLHAIDDALKHKSTLKAEVPYNTTTGEPYMCKKFPNRALRRCLVKGHRRPDIIITDGSPPYMKHIRRVVEMKFFDANTDYSKGQELAYQEIFEEKFVIMRLREECLCDDDKKQPQTVPIPVDVKDEEWGKKAEKVALYGAAGVLALATVAAIICPLDGPVGDIALGSAASATWAAAFAIK